MLPPTLPERSLWHRAHFEMLLDFGVWRSPDDSATFSTACGPLLEQEGLLAFDNYFRDFSFDSDKVLCYQRAEDSKPRVCVPALCREAVLRAAHGDTILAGHPGVGRKSAAVAHSYYWPRLFADVAYFVGS